MNNNNNNSNNIDPNNKKKITKGRQKIQIKKLEDKNSLQVTFSKRRSGLFSKAMELCVLCGAEVGIVVFSPNGKIFLAGHPDFDKILNRYLDQNHSSLDEVNAIPCVQQHNKEYEDATQELENEKKRRKMIEEEKKKNKNNGRFWWQEGNIVDDMGIEEVEEYLKAMKKLKGKVEMRVNEMMMDEYLVPNMNLGNDHSDVFGNINVNVNENISVSGGIDGGVDFDFGFGDDGTLHLWDTTGRSPKVSWLKQHSAPTAGISFSSDDKIVASVRLDKKLYTYDPGSRRPPSCITYEAPFSSLAFIDDDWILTAGTSNGHVVFYDIRGKPQPLTVLRACSSSEAVSSLCWQRAKPVFIDETTCKAETALLGDAVGDSILMPDPHPSVTSSSVSLSTAVSGSRRNSHSGPSAEASSLTVGGTGSVSRTQSLPSGEETPQRSYLRPGGPLARLHAPRSSYNFKDDMEVFSPLVDVQPITPSLDKLWDGHGGAKKDHLPIDKKPSSMLFPSSSRRFPYAEDGANEHSVFDWKSSSTSKQDDARSFALLGSTPSPSSKSEDSSITPPEAWGGEKLSDKFALLRQPLNMPSRYGMSTSSGLTSSSMYSGLQDVSLSQTSISSLTDSNLSHENLRTKDVTSYQETSSLGFPEHLSSSFPSLSLGTKGILGSGNLDSSRTSSLTLTHREPRRTYAERISTTSGTSLSVGSPKTKKTGAETKEELLSNFLSRSDTSAVVEPGIPPAINGGMSQSLKSPQPDPPQGSNFTLQLFQRTLEETLDSFQKSIHEDMRNLHIEILRQFHMQETQMSNVMSSILENQAELMKEIKSLRKENHQLRQLL